MKIEFDYKQQLLDIENMINKIPSKLNISEQTVLKKAGAIIKKHIVRHLDYSDVEIKAKNVAPTNYDGSPYTHMKDDVKFSVRKDKNKNLYVSVRGGKMTGYKWHLLNDGTINMRGNNFMDKAMLNSESEIETMIDNMIEEALSE